MLLWTAGALGVGWTPGPPPGAAADDIGRRGSARVSLPCPRPPNSPPHTHSRPPVNRPRPSLPPFTPSCCHLVSFVKDNTETPLRMCEGLEGRAG